MPEEPITPVGKLKPVNPNQKPVGELKPVGAGQMPHLQNYAPDLNSQNQLENTLNDIVKTSRRTISDSEKDILRDVLSNPNRTPEQATEAIQTLQGYHPKFQNEQQKEGDRTYYYLKRDSNGVLVPKALTYGERPPSGYDVASVWGNPKQANDDSWYTDLGKSLYNGVVGAVQSVAELGQLGSLAITGEESDFLNSTINTAEQLKFTKDESLNTPIYNTEGINQWADLLDLDRFNFSKESLWGTMNMAAESVTEFLTGAKGASEVIKGINGAEKLTKAGISGSAFTASFLQNLGENIEIAKENGLEGRDIAAFALPVTAGQAAIDAKWGLTSNIYKNLFTKPEKQILQEFAKQTLKTSTGELSEAGLKEMIKGTMLAYDRKLATIGKDALASMGQEGLQEAGQDMVEKAGEELYDKLGGEDKFGTDAADPKSFGSYIQNFVTGFVAGAPLSFTAGQQRKNNERQSIDAFKIVEGGQDKINEFKANIYAAERNGELTEQQRQQAEFKIDAYNTYWNKTKDLNMSKEERRKAFKLSFSIEGLKSEIPDNTDGLDPIDIAKVKNKEELIKELQKELNGLLLKQEIIKEPVVGQGTIDKVDKATKPKEGEEKVATLDDLLKRFGALEAEEADEIDLTEKSEKRKAVPKFTDVDEKGNYKFAQLSDPLQQKQSLHDYFKENPQLNNQMNAFIVQGQNNVWKLDLGNGRYIQFARSIEPEQYVGNTEGFPEAKEEYQDSDGRPLTRYTTPVGLRLETIKSDSNPQGYKRVLNIYDKQSGKHIAYAKETKKGTSKYSPKEQKQLQAIQQRDNRTPYQRPAEKESASKEEIKAFANKLKNGLSNPTPEEQQFYENNKKAIEKELKTFRVPSSNIGSNETEVEVSEEVYKKWKQLDDEQKDRVKSLDAYQMNAQEKSARKREISMSYAAKKRELLGTQTAKEKKRVRSNIMTPVDSETEQRDFEQNRPLSETEIQEQLEGEQGREQIFSETGQFQKQTTPGDFNTVLDRIREVMPKVNIKLDNTINGAGQVQGNTLKINPDYAGRSTPIHEAGHILIDAIGYNNPVIKSAIKQLKSTDLWKQTQDLYPELNEEMLGKEVLAEAIGREGEGIFDTEVKKNAFLRLLDYIYGRLNQLLGIDKNIAKSLAKQIIGGIGTSELTGQNEQVQESRFTIDQIRDIADELENKPIDEIPYEELTALYNDIFTSDPFKGKSKIMKDIMTRITLNMKERGLEQDANIDRDVVANKDIKWIDKWFKVLSHFGDAFPELKEFSKLWNSAFFTKMKEARAEKNTHDKLALEVIKEKNKKMGLLDWSSTRLKQALSDQKFKYFDFLDNNGKMITVSEAQKKGLSKAQIDYIKYVRDLFAKRMNLIGDEDIQNMDMDVLRLDKKFAERFQTEGLISAVSGLFGSDNLLNTKVLFKNPNTGKEEYVDFGTVEQALTKYGEKGLVQKGKALIQLFIYAVKARKQLKRDIESGKVKVPRRSEFTLDENGQLKSRFENTKVSRRDYSKDFYSAVNQYIDDTMHIKHISPLVPVINSIEYLNKTGIFDDEGNRTHQKPNVAEWAEKWTKLHILQRPDETAPALDKTLKFLRFMTSALTMWFNVPANVLNVAIGNYNTIRDQDGKTWAKGQGRLFGGKDRKFGVLNKYAYDIIQKYAAIMSDTDSNVGQTGGNIFTKLAYLGQNWGELQIQGSALLGLMDDKDYNSFEYRKNKYDVDELVVKDRVNEKELEARILANLDKVSDVQGKYGAKDKRNIMNNELGKVALMYRVWLPDALRVRYGEKGSWTNQINGGFKEMRRQIADKGFMEAMVSGKETNEVKDFKRNLKGLMATGLLISLVYATDDDDKKSGLAKMFNRALSDVLFIFDADNLKFTVEKPVAVAGPLIKLINVADHLFANEADDFYSRNSKYGDKGDSKLRGDIVGLTPKPVKAAIDEIVED